MYLKELTINGFKSFAKKSELEFSSPITAIVGPNGSGKSNVAESFRFVLGEQSVKAMRGKKGEDLIWGGSEKVSRGNRASVEVVFDNSNKVFALDFDEVKIERVVHRDGQNEYKLNGSTVRLKDVHELLASANIGATGHHIISQGEADRILAAGAKERREMIEDALGLKVYQLKKHEAEKKLQKTQENIAQVESLRREAAPHLKYLRKQVERAERSLQVQAELKSVYAEYLKREDTYIAHNHDRLVAARNEPEAQLKSNRADLEEVLSLLKKVQEREVNQELQAADEEFRQVSQERQKAEQSLSQLQGQISLLERRLSQIQTNNAAPMVVSRQELEKLVAEIEKEATIALEKDETHIKHALQALVRELQKFLSKQSGEIIDTSKEDKAELASLQNELRAAEKTVKAAIEKEREAEAVLESLRSEQVTETEHEREAERKKYTLLESIRTLELQLRDIDSKLTTLERDRVEFKRELQEAVSLIGRSASDYYNLDVRDQDGNPVSIEAIVSEDRDAQRTRRRELEKLKIRLEELGTGATEELMKEYKDAQDRDAFLEHELGDLAASVVNLNELIGDLQSKLEEQFVLGIEKISVEFNRFFTLMFGGGSAELKQVAIQKRKSEEDEEEDEAEKESGVELAVTLPNKRVKGLEMLSGGERALTSIAVIFAMSQVNPPPFIILDETDAALDEANSRRYGDMIEELAKKSQLVLITHNRETMSRAGILYGITMGADGVSKVLSVKFDEAAAVAK